MPRATKNPHFENSLTLNGWNFEEILAQKTPQGLTPCKDDKPKYTEITPFKAGSGYTLSAKEKI